MNSIDDKLIVIAEKLNHLSIAFDDAIGCLDKNQYSGQESILQALGSVYHQVTHEASIEGYTGECCLLLSYLSFCSDMAQYDMTLVLPLLQRVVPLEAKKRFKDALGLSNREALNRIAEIREKYQWIVDYGQDKLLREIYALAPRYAAFKDFEETKSASEITVMVNLMMEQGKCLESILGTLRDYSFAEQATYFPGEEYLVEDIRTYMDSSISSDLENIRKAYVTACLVIRYDEFRSRFSSLTASDLQEIIDVSSSVLENDANCSVVREAWRKSFSDSGFSDIQNKINNLLFNEEWLSLW